MKNNIYFLAILFFFTLNSCKKDRGPIPVAEQFLAAIQDHDYDKAAEFGTKETIKLLKQFKKIEELNVSEAKEKLNKITILSEDIQNYARKSGNRWRESLEGCYEKRRNKRDRRPRIVSFTINK